MADVHVPIRAGTDIAFLGGIIRYIVENDRAFREYVQHYTNAPVILKDEVATPEDLDGLFSGWNPTDHLYEPESWNYKGVEGELTADRREQSSDVSGNQAHGAHGMTLEGGEPPEIDIDLEHPRCVYQLLRHHYRRYTPEMVADICGVAPEKFLAVAEALCANSGRERTSAICYAVGWTQHTHGVQNIRAASVIQLLLGNIGRPGGGILALRGHANIQGSTDIPTLYDILPGYIPMPHPVTADSLGEYLDKTGPTTGVWGDLDAYMISLLKAWWGDHATADNDYCLRYLPTIDGDHSVYPMMLRMLEGQTKGYILVGQNPVVGNANSGLQARALASLDWLVVRDLTEIESAAIWQDAPEECGTEVFFLPAAAHTEKDGTFTNTQRLLQWHHKAVEPREDRRSDLWFTYHLGRRIRERLASSSDPRDRPILDLTWDYPLVGPHGEPDAEAILQEINGRDADGGYISKYQELEADGSTSCGSWLHCGIYADGVNQTARRKPRGEQNWIAPEWAWAWPANTRLLYNRAAADPDGNPWSERKRYVWWDADEAQWTGVGDHPDFVPDMAPDYTPPEGATGTAGLRGTTPFIAHPDGLGWIWAPAGLVDGPLPTHYEPHESPVDNALYTVRADPTRQVFDRPDNRYNPPGSPRYPFVLTTYRLTEHHTAGGMSRWLPYLSELQPEFFCEVSPELAEERGLDHLGWATIITARNAVEARVLVTPRIPPLTVQGRRLHQIGLPYHWGWTGYSTGDSANDLVEISLDPNVHIQETKAFACDIRPGRRPTGAARPALVREYQQRAGITERTGTEP
jgi:formate dehydrogenase major subunit